MLDGTTTYTEINEHRGGTQFETGETKYRKGQRGTKHIIKNGHCGPNSLKWKLQQKMTKIGHDLNFVRGMEIKKFSFGERVVC